MTDALDLPQGSSSTLLEWRVLVGPLDDWPGDARPSPDRQIELIESCVTAFRDKLMDAHRKGTVPIGYGPIVENKHG